MLPNGKRRSSQRVRGNRIAASSTEGPQSKQGSPATPPLNKKRRTLISSPENRYSNAAPGQRGNGESESEDENGVTTMPSVMRGRPPRMPKVRPPPAPRRKSTEVDKSIEGILPSHKTSSRNHEEDVENVHISETINEESGLNEGDVYLPQREPLEKNAFYTRYVSADFEDEIEPRNTVRRVFSPISPENRTAAPAGGRRDIDNNEDTEELRDSGEVANVPRPDECHYATTSSLSVTREMMSSFYRDLERKFVSEIRSLHTLMSEKFRFLESLEGSLTQQLNEIRVVSSAGRNSSCSQGRPTPLAKYESKLDLATPHADWVFNTETICKVLRFNVCMFVVGLANETGDVMDNISLALRAILFGLLPSQKRVAFSNGVGRRHSKFRFTVVLNILFNVQQNVFKRFLPLDPSTDVENAEAVDVGDAAPDGARIAALTDNEMQIKQPKWLKMGFVRKRHVEESRARIESHNACLDSNGDVTAAAGKQRKSWLTVKDTPDPDDISRYGALKAYRCVTTGLYQAREKARWVLFEELTYIMAVWESDSVDVDQRTLTMKWDENVLEFSDPILSAVPQCCSRKMGMATADDQNQYILAEFLSVHQEMVLYVTHDVNVRVAGSSPRQRRAMEGRLLCRAVNLIDVAAKFCIVFTEQSVGDFSHLQFLGAHPDSLRCIYAVALMLRGVVNAFMDEYVVNGTFTMPLDGNIPHVEFHGMSLEYLLPAASVRKRLLMSRCLRLGSEDFEKMNVRPRYGEGESSPTLSNPTDDDHIDAGDHGVVLL